MEVESVEWLRWTVLSVEVYVESLQAVVVAVVVSIIFRNVDPLMDSIVSRSVSGVCSESIGGSVGQHYE